MEPSVICMMPTLNIKHGKSKRKNGKYILSMYNSYNTSDVKAHRTIVKSDRDKIIYITRNFVIKY